jgi:heptosyltransferase-2
MLEDFKDCHVTWITAHVAKDLLEGNYLIDQLILADSPGDVPREKLLNHYHSVINLEKQRDWCLFAETFSADHRYGFKDWAGGGAESFYPESALALAKGLDCDNYRPLQETLFQTIGREWVGQRYVMAYQPRNLELYDIGLNYHVGPKWPNKAWPLDLWKELHGRLEKNYSLCWQQSLNSIKHYIEWLNSCKLIITTDSLGLHLSLGLRKKIVALFGPTPAEQVYMYGRGVKLTPCSERSCIPCFHSKCSYDTCCMDTISVEMVFEAVQLLLGQGKPALTPAETMTKESLAETVAP